MVRHFTEIEIILKKQVKMELSLSINYYKIKVIGTRLNKEDNLKGERKGKIDSLKIKRESDNNLIKGKDVESLFKGDEDD